MKSEQPAWRHSSDAACLRSALREAAWALARWSSVNTRPPRASSHSGTVLPSCAISPSTRLSAAE